MLRQLLLSPTTEDAMSPATVHMHPPPAAAQQHPPAAVDTQHVQIPGGYYAAPGYDASHFNSVSSATQPMPASQHQHQAMGGYQQHQQQQQDYPDPVKVDNSDYAVLSTIPQDQQFQYQYQQHPPPYGRQSMSGLPEMFSSTYAVLSGDPNMPDQNWNYYQQGYQCENGGYYQHQQPDYQNWNGGQTSWCDGQMQQENATPGDPYLDYSNDSGISSTVNDNSPPPNESLPEVERVLCIACKGVYPSKRSLTGHIGRNDVCRDSIIQKCMEQPPAGAIQADEDLIGKFTSICPFCDKFISNFKVNIRRHLVICSKSPHKAGAPSQALPQRKAASKVKGPSGSPSPTDPDSPALELPPAPPPKKVSNTNNADDPYICSYCAFVTVYKGNMKRHLGSCHQMNDEGIRQAGGLDSMRASSRDPNMPVPAPTSARSFRGRKPKNC